MAETMMLSVVMPFFERYEELAFVLPRNAPFLRDAELVLALDEPSEESRVVALCRALGLRARVVVNDVPHPWRNPAKALNVGARHAEGDIVLVVSPESLFVGDVPALAVATVATGRVAVGRVEFAMFDDLATRASPSVLFDEIAMRRDADERSIECRWYGSIAFSRTLFERIGGYDETKEEWGGDDDDLRIRMAMAGAQLEAIDMMRILHLWREARHPVREIDARYFDAHFCPATMVANRGAEMGRDFSRVAWDWRRD